MSLQNKCNRCVRKNSNKLQGKGDGNGFTDQPAIFIRAIILITGSNSIGTCYFNANQ